MFVKLGAGLAAFALGFSVPAFAQDAPVMNDPEPDGHRIAEGQVLGNFYPAAGRGPGILLIGGSESGLNPFPVRSIRALQQSGFSVLQISYWGGPGQSPVLVHIPMELFEQGCAGYAVDRR